MSGPRSTRAALATVLVALLTLLAGAAPAGARSEQPPSRLLVTASEFSLVLSRAQIAPGPSIIQMYNRGEDPHNLRLQKLSGGPVRRIAELEPETAGTLEMRLHKGVRYRLWCSLNGHRQAGMEATLKVRRR